MQVVAELKFEKIREIGTGQGLNSVVYLARDQQLNAEFAIKQIDKTTFWNPDCFAEAKAVLAVAHPNVAAVQYACERGTEAFISMPFYKNGSLSDRLATGPIPLVELCRLGQEILQGLAYIHMKGFLHLDIKPSNILLDDRGRPLIADFGQARNIGTGGLVTAPRLYSKTFPPEVLKTGKAVIQSDLYMTGMLLYRALNGEGHFNSQLAKYPDMPTLSAAIGKGRFPDRKNFLPHVPKKLRTLVRKAMNVDPMQRFDSATSMADALGRVQIPIDWRADHDPSGGMTWTGSPRGTAHLIVELKNTSTGWKTEVYTVNANRRAKGRDQLWKTHASRAEALDHLSDVFAAL